MPEEEYEEYEEMDEEAEPQQESNAVRNQRAQIQRQAKELKAQAAELNEAKAAQRELAFIKAGIDTSTAIGKLFMKSFDGDLKDSEAIKTEAMELGLMQAPKTEAAEETPEVPAEPTGSTERQALAGDGVPGGAPGGVDPNEELLAMARHEMETKGGTEESAMAWLIAGKARGVQDGTIAPLNPRTGRLG